MRRVGCAVLVLFCACAGREPDSAALREETTTFDRVFTIDGDFGRLAEVVATPEGRIYAADAQTKRIHGYDRDGAPLGSWGGAGEGPGEFEFLHGLEASGGVLTALDPVMGRVTWFSEGPTGLEFERTAALSTETGVHASYVFARVGSSLFTVARPPTRGQTGRLALANLGGEWVRDSITDALGGAQLATRALGALLVQNMPFGGRTFLLSYGDSLLVEAQTNRPGLRFFDARGESRGTAALDLGSRSVTEEDVERYAELVGGGSSPLASRSKEAVLDAFDDGRLPARHPLFLHIASSGDGIWIQPLIEAHEPVPGRHSPLYGAEEQLLIHYDLDGTERGRGRIRGDLRLAAAWEDRLLFVETDEFGVHRVAVFRIEE